MQLLVGVAKEVGLLVGVVKEVGVIMKSESETW